MGLTFSETVGGDLLDGVLVVSIDNPPVNAASASMRAGLGRAVAHAASTDEVRAVVIIGAGRSFVGGADIREFGQPMTEPTLPQIVERIEASEKPIVAAINGVALGRRLRDRAGLPLPDRVEGGQDRPAGSETRDRAGGRRHATPAAPDRHGSRVRHDRDRPHRAGR